MPPRYPNHPPQMSQPHPLSSMIVYSPGGSGSNISHHHQPPQQQFPPRGGTGDTGNDSFASSFTKTQPSQWQQNFNSVAANDDFHQQQRHRTGSCFSSNAENSGNAWTKYHYGAAGGQRRDSLGNNGGDQQHETFESGSILGQHSQHGNTNHHGYHLTTQQSSFYPPQQAQPTAFEHLFSNQKRHQNNLHQQMDRREDDDQRSPERRPSKTAASILIEPASPERNGGGFVPHQASPERRETFGQVRPGSAGYQINMISSTSTHQRNNHVVYGTTSNGSTLSDILQKSRRSTNNADYSNPVIERLAQPQHHHQHYSRRHQHNNNQAATSYLQPTKQTSAPNQPQQAHHNQQQKTRKKTKTILDQREHFKIRPARCYLGGSDQAPPIHYSQHTLTWQQAIACIEDLGVDMSQHLYSTSSVLHTEDIPSASQNTTKNTCVAYDFDEPVMPSNPSNFRQAARSDGFKNWSGTNTTQAPSGNQRTQKQYGGGRLQTDFYQAQRKGSAGSGLSQSELLGKPSLTQNNFFKKAAVAVGKKNDDNENVSSNHEEDEEGERDRHQHLDEVQKNDLLESHHHLLSYQKSPSRIQKQAVASKDDKQLQKQAQSEGGEEAFQTLTNLRYSDLIYLLNILKLQRSKNAEQVKFGGGGRLQSPEAREQWVTDLQLALSVAVSAEDRDSKDTNMIARVLIEKVEACVAMDPHQQMTLQQEGEHPFDLKYEHFIGPLVILCAVNNLIRAQGNNTAEAECISTIKLCFDQFERYYAKAVSTAVGQQRRSNSMSGGSLAFPAARMDSFEVELDTFRNFTVSLKRFIERESSLPCKPALHSALESITLGKVQSNFLIFPGGSQLILSQLNRLFGTGTSTSTAGPSHENFLLDSRLLASQQQVSQENGSFGPSKKCIKHGITLCPCDASSDPQQQNNNNQAVKGSLKPQFTLQPQIAGTAEQRRQHSMVDFSASSRRGLKTQDSNTMNNGSNGGDYAAVGDLLYRPFSTIISGRSDNNTNQESVRPSTLYGQKTANQPMSLELEHKRSLPSQSQHHQQTSVAKSVQKPKKGILKQSSSYLDSQTKPPSSLHQKKGGGGATQPTSTQPSPYLAMKKLKGGGATQHQIGVASKTGATNPSPRGSNTSTTSKKQHQINRTGNTNNTNSNSHQYDSQRNLLQRLGQEREEPPKFSHANNTNNAAIFSPKATPVASKRQKAPAIVNKSHQQHNQHGQISSLSSILNNANASSSQYGGAGGYSNNNGAENASTTASNLVANSMKYLVRTTPANTHNANSSAENGTGAGKHLHHHQHHHNHFQKTTSSLLNTSTHSSNVLLQAQNMQNRNDSFGMHSSYSNNHNHNHHHNHHSNYQQPSSTSQNQNTSGTTHNNSYKIATLHYSRQSTNNNPSSSQATAASTRIQQLMSPQNNSNQLPRASSRDLLPAGRGSIHQSPQRTTTTGLMQQNQILMTGSSAARRSSSHNNNGGGYGHGSSSQPSSSLLQTSTFQNFHQNQHRGDDFQPNFTLHSSGGVNYPHPRLLLNNSSSSARKSGQNHNQQPTTNHTGINFHHQGSFGSGSEIKVGGILQGGGSMGGGIAHTDFNQVSQFSLSSLKDSGSHQQHGYNQQANVDSDYASSAQQQNNSQQNAANHHRRRLQY